ncbi:MAG: hypothetical protein JRN15_15995, partial [Nitrososphaerota archaeon]|nr:hypothetical protein [Nitrososphaerota archaeon]
MASFIQPGCNCVDLLFLMTEGAIIIMVIVDHSTSHAALFDSSPVEFPLAGILPRFSIGTGRLNSNG